MAHKTRALLALLVIVASLAGSALPAIAQRDWRLQVGDSKPAAGGEIILVPGTVKLTAALERAVRSAFRNAATLIDLHTYYSVTGLQQNRPWYFISMAGFDAAASHGWSLEDGQAWLGLVLVLRNSNGTYTGAVEGTPAFSTLLAKVPASVLSPSARFSLDPTLRHNLLPEIYRFPWQPGTSMMYGMKGVHEGGFAILGAFKAVDFLSDGDISAGHAPNSLQAAAPGSINYVCDDGTSVAVRIGDLLYVHLMSNPRLKVGASFAAGEELGQMRLGWFNSICGYADQAPNWFHVHWAFPTGDTFQAGGWTLNLADGVWRRGTETRATLDWLAAENPRWHETVYKDTAMKSPCNESDVEAVFVFKQWETDAPSPGCPATGFAARYVRQASFPGDAYTFHVERRGGARLSVDDKTIIDAWANGTASVTATVNLSGVHTVTLDFRNTADLPLINMWWNGNGSLPVPAPTTTLTKTWRAEYYGNTDLWGQPVIVQAEDGALQHDWGTHGPGYGLPVEDFSARFSRLADFDCGLYRFAVHADDGVRIRVGDRVVLDEWR
ncbi:MAG TPA: PA14 domain-containing protein, partial [Anaerolineae bacterium]